MRKLTVEIELNEQTIKEFEPTFEHVHSYEILESLKIDYEEGICIDLIEFHLKEGVSIIDLKFIDKMEVLSVLKSEGDKHTCLVKYREAEDKKEYFKDTDLDLVHTTPTIISEKTVTVSCIGSQENLAKLIDIIKTYAGKIVNMKFQKAIYQKHDVLSILTEKQKDVIVAAQKYGYYDYPKKINSDKLSDKVNISKATLVQHLRKAEGRIMKSIAAGFNSKY